MLRGYPKVANSEEQRPVQLQGKRITSHSATVTHIQLSQQRTNKYLRNINNIKEKFAVNSENNRSSQNLHV